MQERSQCISLIARTKRDPCMWAYFQRRVSEIREVSTVSEYEHHCLLGFDNDDKYKNDKMSTVIFERQM